MENKLQTEEKPEEKPQDELVGLENLEIEPLTDENLENVVGGACSGWLCSSVGDNATET